MAHFVLLQSSFRAITQYPCYKSAPRFASRKTNHNQLFSFEGKPMRQVTMRVPVRALRDRMLCAVWCAQKGEDSMRIRIWFRSVRSFLFVLVASTILYSQNPPVSDPQALSLAAQSIIALTGGASISDVTLSGTAKWSNGTDVETASATLMAKGTGESRFDMTLAAGPRSEIRNDGSNTHRGELLATDGSVSPWANHNCMVNSSWFFPQLSVLGATGDATLIFIYVGQETRNGATVQHIQSYRYSARDTTATQHLSKMDIYLNAVSLLPSAFVFNIHPNKDSTHNLTVEVDFSSYQSVDGVQVPFRIQRYVAGNLGLDFSVASTQLNSGLGDNLFTIQ
jgi:hypothetical protein